MTKEEGRSRRFDYEGVGKILLGAVQTFLLREGIPTMSKKGAWEAFAQWIRSDKTLSPWNGSGVAWASRHRLAEYRFSPEGEKQKIEGDLVLAIAKEKHIKKPKLWPALHRDPSTASKQLHALVPWTPGWRERLAKILGVRPSTLQAKGPEDTASEAPRSSKSEAPPEAAEKVSRRDAAPSKSPEDGDPSFRVSYVQDIIEQGANSGKGFSNMQLRVLLAYLKSGSGALVVEKVFETLED